MTSIATLGVVVTTQGVSEADRQLDKLTQTGAKVEAQAAKTAAGMEKTALSAKQLQAATRGLPAQFTDIATALGSGQRPLQVLLQQGGQLKDMFGGIGPAARAMGSYVAGLVNPFTIATAAAVGLFLAWKQGSEEAREFNRALISTGNYAGVTAGQMQDLAESLDNLAGVTEHRAAAALAAVAGTGRFTADQFAVVTEAAVAWEAATGQAVEETIKQFERLAKDPVNAILELNDAQHFLTRETLKQIDSLKEQGRSAEASRVAVQAYADALNDRAPKMTENLGYVESGWNAVKNAAKEAWDEVLAIGREESLSSLQRRMESFQQAAMNPVLTAADRADAARRAAALQQEAEPLQRSMVQAAVDASQGLNNRVDSGAERARRQAEQDFDRIALSNLDKRQKLEREIADIRKTGAAAGKSELEIEKQVAAARARAAESAPKGRKSRDDSASIESARDRFADMTARFQAELEGPLQRAEGEHLRRMREIEQAAKKGKVSHEELATALELEGKAYARAKEEIQHRFDAEVASLSGPVAAAQATHEAALRRIEEIKRQTTLTGEQYNAMLAEEAKRHDEATVAAERAADPIGALLSDMRLEIDMIGESNARRAVLNELIRERIDLASPEAQAALATADAFEAEARAKQRSIDLMDEFRQGASDAIADFVTGAKSAKEAFTDFFDNLAERITQMIAERWIEQAFGAMGTNQTGSSGGWVQMIASLFASANGNVFAGGNAVAFANGGVVSRATMFPMRDGRTGLMGEAGPEAIMPLARGADGKLGVRAARGSSGGNSTSIVINQNFSKRADTSTLEQGARAAGRESARGMARTGR